MITGHDKELEKFKQQKYPSIILCGKIEALTDIYVRVNEKLHRYETIEEPVEICFKILKALRSFSSINDHVWLFIQQLVYEITSKKTLLAVDNAVAEIEKLSGVESVKIPDYFIK